MEQKLTPAVNLEPSIEVRIMARLDDMRDRMDMGFGQLRDLRSMLLGSSDGPVELPHGRIVQLESRMRKVEDSIEMLKAADLRAAAYWNAARILGHVLTGVLGGATLAIVQWLIHAVK